MSGRKTDNKSDRIMDVLLNTIKELVFELHPSWPKTRLILPDSSLSRDLGLDSLARVELLARIEKSMGVILPEKIFMDAETPRDLWQAIVSAGSAFVSAPSIEIKVEQMDEAYDLPYSAKTLVDVLNWHIEAHPDRPHVRLYSDEGEGEVLGGAGAPFAAAKAFFDYELV
ncbi:MAG: acyl carrier protein [Syntrophaceae bacterium]|nr:acyl carrier protein [Syntrophaceae bacterium]